ncbi:MAG: ACT domain-containing protein [Ilumatobacteraceae bacterium]
MFTYVVRVWVPDRPGALGQVASRIGAVRGDVVGIEILERGAGMAIDELVVTMPDGDLVDLLVAEIGQVDGTAVEEIRAVAPDRPDTSIVALQSAAQLIEVHPDKRLDRFCHELVELMEGTWSAALDLDAARSLVEVGDPPEAVWLAAFIEGSRHLDPHAREAQAPPDVAWAHLPRHGIAVAVGRAGWAFRARERQQMDLLGQIADGLLPD